jgi:hypothetical protein
MAKKLTNLNLSGGGKDLKTKQIDGKKLKSIMKEQGRRQSWLANTLALSEATISYWLSGAKPVPDVYTKLIARMLGVAIRDLVN